MPRAPPASAPATRWAGPRNRPDPEFYKTLAKALEEIAGGLEQLGKGDE